MHHPRVPSRPQAYRVRATPRRRSARRSRLTLHLCLTALAVLAIVTTLGTHRTAQAKGMVPAAHAATASSAPDGWLVDGRKVVVPFDDPPTVESTQVPSVGPGAFPSRPAARRVLVQLTAYSASVEEGTAWGITYTGVRARPGTVAVDPTVIPLGSRLRIDGLPGLYRAEDTGGGIRGAHVDVFMGSRWEALQFGRRYGVAVDILD
jgi:3D (Asp-Asp-Asp) domain-containing protein